MYIIDDTYFTREIAIPNVQDNDPDVPSSSNPFEAWIDKESRLCLQGALGNTYFNEFDAGVDANGDYTGAVAKYDNLVDGETYSYNGQSYTWAGLKYTQGTFKGSLLAKFTYCKWLEFQLSKQSGVGEVRGEAVNSMSVNSTHRYVTIWNQFVKEYQEGYSSSNTLTIVNGVPFYDYFGEGNSYVSLIQYLKHKESDFEDADLKTYEYLNTFGL